MVRPRQPDDRHEREDLEQVAQVRGHRRAGGRSDQQGPQYRRRDRVLEHRDAKCLGVAARGAYAHPASCRPERRQQHDQDHDVERQSSHRVPDVRDHVLPARGRACLQAVPQGLTRVRPGVRRPHRAAAPCEEAAHGLVLCVLEARQHRIDPRHLLRDDTLEVEQGGALNRQRFRGRLDGLHRAVDLRDDRPRRLQGYRDAARLAPGRLELGQTLQGFLQTGRPVREQLQPRGRLELLLLPQLVLGLDRVEGRLIPQDALGGSQIAIDLLMQLGEALHGSRRSRHSVPAAPSRSG